VLTAHQNQTFLLDWIAGNKVFPFPASSPELAFRILPAFHSHPFSSARLPEQTFLVPACSQEATFRILAGHQN
jgi:hypothetical protein